MVASNGSLKASNGHVTSRMKGKSAQRGPTKRQSRGSFAWLLSAAARITIYVAIATIFVRCPQSLDECDDDSPFICKPYFHVKAAVSPHLQPLYEQYASPYVEIAKPYYPVAERVVFSPLRTVVHQITPWVKSGQDQVLAQWEKNGQPQLVWAQEQAQIRYEETVAPQLARASDVVGPYYDQARTHAVHLYSERLRPGYELVHPYVMQGYGTVHDFTTDTAVPTALWAWNRSYAFIDTTVWPQVRILYVENVEPQLVRIGERLGRYKTKSKSNSILNESYISFGSDSVVSSFSKPTSQIKPSSSTTRTIDDVVTDSQPSQPSIDNASESIDSSIPTETESNKGKSAKEIVAEDLDLWQKKFAAQADEGAAAIEESVDEISQRMIEEGVKKAGQELVVELESVVNSGVQSLKQKISSLVETSGDDIVDFEQNVVKEIRSAGVEIRKRAQKIREWREKYDADLQKSVSDAADVHFKILDETRSLALQQIGMKWAWTDGITHKDWAKYHELKNTLSQWTDQLQDLIVSFPGLLAAQDASAQLEDEGMEIAAAAASELTRLKEVAHYKVLAQDATENFEIEAMKLAAESAQAAKEAEKIAAENAKAAAAAAAEAASEKAASEEDDADSVANDASFTIVATEGVLVDEASTAASDAQETPAEAADEISRAGRDSFASASQSGENFVDRLSQSASSILSKVTEAAGKESVSHTDIPDDMSYLASEASETVLGDTQTMVANVTDVPPVVVSDGHQPEQNAKASETPTVKPALFGAAAQAVSDRQPILEDYVDTDKVASATNAAEGVFSSAVSRAAEQYSSAVSVVSAQVYGTPKPVHEELVSSVSAVYDNAVAQASSRFRDAVDAASKGIYGTPTPTPTTAVVDWSKVEAIAAQRLNEGRLWAEIQYQSAMIAMGLATPTPTSSSQKLAEQARHNYYAGLGMAQARYSSFVAAASSAFSLMTATPTPTNFVGSASSAASVARESASSMLQAAEDAVESAYSAAADSVVQAAAAVDESIAGAVDGAAEQVYIAGFSLAEAWDNVLAQISAQVYAEPTGISWYDSLLSDASAQATAATDAVAHGVSSAADAASGSAVTASAEAAKQYEAVSELVSELLSGKEPTFTESVLSRLGAVYATASVNVESFVSEAGAAASSIGDRVGSAASEATEAVKDTLQHAKDEL